MPGRAGEAGGDVPDPVAESTGVGVVAVAQEADPDGQVGGDVRRNDPSVPRVTWVNLGPPSGVH